MRRLQRKRKFGMESLESRRLLAGDVLVSLTDGDLTLTGDELANEISLDVQADGALTVRSAEEDGLSVETDFGLMEQTEVTISPENLTGDVRVELGAGDDSITVNGEAVTDGAMAGLAGSLDIDMGDGADTVVVGGEVGEDGASGEVTIGPNFSLEGDLTIQTGAGADQVDITSAAASIGGNLHVMAGGGENVVNVGVDAVVEETPEEPGNGDNDDNGDNGETGENGEDPLEDILNGNLDDLFNNLADEGGVALQQLNTATISVEGNTIINSGDANDQVAVANLDAQGALAVMAGGGDDQITVEAVSSDAAVVNAGDGNDTATIADLSAEAVMMNAGDGDDDVIASAIDSRALVASLGAGATNSFSLDNSALGASGETEFESQVMVVRGQDGEDVVDLAGIQTSNLLASLGGGNDFVNLADVGADRALVNTGAGDDILALTGEVDSDRFFALLGDGDDEILDAGVDSIVDGQLAGGFLPENALVLNPSESDNGLLGSLTA